MIKGETQARIDWEMAAEVEKVLVRIYKLEWLPQLEVAVLQWLSSV